MFKTYKNNCLIHFLLYIQFFINFIRLNFYIWLMPVFVGLYSISLFTDISPRLKDYIFILTFFMIFMEFYTANKIFGKKYFIFFLVTLIIIFPSALFYQEIEYYFKLMFYKMQYFIMAFLPVFFISKINLYRFWKIYIAFVFIIICFSLLYIKPVVNLSYSGIFLSRNSAGMLALFSVLVFWNTIKKKYIFYPIVAFVIYFIIISGSKTAIYGFILFILSCFIYNIIFSIKFKIKLLYVSILFLLSYLLFNNKVIFIDLIRFFDNSAISSSNQRVVDMYLGIVIWLENILAGVGISKFTMIIVEKFDFYAYVLFPNVDWHHLVGYDGTSSNAIIDLLAIYGLYAIPHIIFLLCLIYNTYRIIDDFYLKSMLLLPMVILMVNSFSLGNGYEFIYYLFTSYIISVNIKKVAQ